MLTSGQSKLGADLLSCFTTVAPKKEKIPLALSVYLAKKNTETNKQITTVTNTGEEGAACKRLLLDLCVLEMVAPLVLHAKSKDIEKAFIWFFRIIVLILEYSQSF